ncbi:baseplate hub protein [Desulfatitalea tepidiphila]|uniref:baseplate hub protein n=1 Tax=Desulfatitalea tepidiphila TaxID=1185843 RepID=UPI00128EFF20|nr:hypothetical protein [Desulfatitalea tepidiphila]
MTDTLPYRRRVRVLIGPLEEWRGGGNEKLSVALDGDGTQSGLRIKFQVHQHVVSTATPTVIQIYNLSKELRNELQKPAIQIALWVGWYDTDLVLLYTGSLLQATNYRHGPDIVTTLLTNAAFGGLSRTVLAQTFAGGSKLRDIVLNIAKRIPGVVVDPKNVNINTTKRIGNQGLSFALPINEALDGLSRVYGFSWRVENKIFYAIVDGTYLGTNKPVISHRNGFLLRCEPMLTGAFQQQRGVIINSILNPYVKAGGLVALDSAVNPQLNRDYVVHELFHNGDTHASTWESHVHSFIQVG